MIGTRFELASVFTVVLKSTDSKNILCLYLSIIFGTVALNLLFINSIIKYDNYLFCIKDTP